MDFNNSNFHSVTSDWRPRRASSHVFEASRPRRLFDQRLGCEFRRSESGSEAPQRPPFTPAPTRAREREREGGASDECERERERERSVGVIKSLLRCPNSFLIPSCFPPPPTNTCLIHPSSTSSPPKIALISPLIKTRLIPALFTTTELAEVFPPKRRCEAACAPIILKGN